MSGIREILSMEVSHDAIERFIDFYQTVAWQMFTPTVFRTKAKCNQTQVFTSPNLSSVFSVFQYQGWNPSSEPKNL